MIKEEGHQPLGGPVPRFNRFLFAVAVMLPLTSCAHREKGQDPFGPAQIAGAPTPDPTGDVILVGAGNISRCATNNDEATATLLDAIPGTVVALGDNALPAGRLVDYQNCYGPTWGRHFDRTRPVLGNHEYDSSSTADGFFDYFGDRGGPRGKGYYSYDLGEWHIIVLNDNGR